LALSPAAVSVCVYLPVWLGCGRLRVVPDEPVRDDAAGLRAANARLRALLAERDAEIAVLRGHLDELTALQAEAGELRERAAGLEAQVADLAARLGQNSQNSSRPPSSDGLAKPAPKSLRGKSGRKPGRPKGQPGVTMQLSDRPDAVVRHEPACCSSCAAGLAGAPEAGVVRRQVTEIPEARAVVTEHQMTGRRCGCGTVTWAGAPAGITAPVQYGPRAAAIAAYLWHGQFLSRARAGQAMADLFGIAPSPGSIASMTRRIAAAAAPAAEAVRSALAAAPVAHFDETGFRVAGRLAWVHSASSGKYALVTVHEKRGRDGMDAAGVLPGFAGIACHDAWAPYDCYDCGGHALCCAHVLRELTAVTETGTDRDVTWARQAIDALLALKKAADAARAGQLGAISEKTLQEHSRWFREAASAGIALNAGRRTALQRKRHALASRMAAREADYLRFARDLRVPFDNNEAERVIRMSKLRIKVSGCMRSMKGAQVFCAIRTYLATAARHGIGWLDALTQAAAGTPWIPETG
jgi:transposase